MRHCSVLFLIGLFMVVSGRPSPASAEASKIATSLGDLRWGMSEHEVVTFVKRKIDERLDEQLAKTRDSHKQDQLKSDAKRARDSVERGIVQFEGHSRWDSSPIAGEFRAGNGESMIAYDDGASQNYYFFVSGHLWKWYKAYDTGMFGGAFKKFSQSIEKKFGQGHDKTGELSPGQGKTQWVEFLDRNSRLRAADNAKRGVYALIFEEMATVRELASSRPATPHRIIDDEDDSPKSNSNSNNTEVARAGNTHRSVFAAEQHTETDAEYRARVKRMETEEREKAQRVHARKEDAKKGEVLKPLEGINDADPLSGL